MRVRTDVDPAWRPVFRIDPETGDVVPIGPRHGVPVAKEEET
jgi:hypothetical protein